MTKRRTYYAQRHLHLALVLALAAPATALADKAATTKATALIGSTAKSPAGETLGTIRDLVIDLDDSRVRYAIVEAQDKLVRYSLVQFDPPAAGDHVVFHVARERLAEAPGMDARGQGFGLMRASDLLGASIHDREGKLLGKLAEMTIDWRDGTVLHAVADLDPTTRIPLDDFSMRGNALVLEPGGETSPVNGAARGAADEEPNPGRARSTTRTP